MKQFFSNEQKLVFEILFLYRTLQQKFGLKNDEDVEYPSYLPDIETAKRILSEGRKFEFASYLSLLKELPEKDREVQVIETCHRQFKTPFISRHTFEDSKILNIKFDDETNIDPLHAIGIIQDNKGMILFLLNLIINTYSYFTQ